MIIVLTQDLGTFRVSSHTRDVLGLGLYPVSACICPSSICPSHDRRCTCKDTPTLK